jgi:nickel transport protein
LKAKKEGFMGLKANGLIGLWSLFFLFTVATPHVHAHRVTLFAWVAEDKVHTESNFSGGKPVNGGRVTVYDGRSNEKLLEGETDAYGKFSFDPPRKTRLRIELQAGAGHRGEWVITEEEFGRGGEMTPATTQQGSALQSPRGPGSGSSPDLLTSRETELAMERVLDRKLAPLLKHLAQLEKQGPSLRDVLGGIGYIFGLVGVGAYVSYRRCAKRKTSTNDQ